MAKTSKRGVTLTDGGNKPKHHLPGNVNITKKKKKKKSSNVKKNVKPKIASKPSKKSPTPSKKSPTQLIQVMNLFVQNNNEPLSNLEISEKTGIISHNIRRITGESTKTGLMVRVDRGVYKLSNGEFRNLNKLNTFGKTKIEDQDNSKVKKIAKEIVDNLTIEDIKKAFKVAEPKYYNDKNLVSSKYEEYINIEFVLNNNYYLEKGIDKNNKIGIRYEFSGKYKHNFVKAKSKPVNGRSKNYWIPLFPLFVYILKNSTDKSFRKEYNLESYNYFISHLNLIFEDLNIVSSTQIASSLRYKIHQNYLSLFDKTIVDGMKIEKELRLKIWNDIKNVYLEKDLTTREEWNKYIYDKYNIGLHKSDSGIYRETRRTVTITKDQIGLAFSVHSVPDGPYNDKVDDYGMVYDFPDTKTQTTEKRVIESMKRLYENNIPLFVIVGPAGGKVLKLGWITSINTISREWIISFSDKLVVIEKAFEEENITNLFDKKRKKTQTKGTARPNAREFRDSVIKRYGLECSFCDITTKEILEAAHIIPYSKNGVDHPENGLILCRNHHRLLDNGLILINPESMELESSEELESIGVLKKNIKSLPKLPGKPFLEWLYKKMK